jgi:cystathionine beta-lyase/cystathionine gamma-synthase
MAAVTEAIDVALKASGTPTPTVALAMETYSQTRRYVNFLTGMGPKFVYFDSGDKERVAETIDRHQPDVIITETVSNYTGVPVLDTDFILDYARQQEKPPILVLDNTLPLSTAQPLGEKIEADDKILVVESGTKSYSLNGEIMGIGYTKNEELLQYLRQLRRTRGSLPGTASQELISDLLPEDRATFDERNRRLFKNTGDIAIRLAQGVDGNEEYLISHPVLPNHPNQEFYKRTYPEGGTPIFYIISRSLHQNEVTKRLWAHPGVQEQARLGQSFGFDLTRIVPDEFVPAVRIAGGADTDGEALGEALAEALNS